MCRNGKQRFCIFSDTVNIKVLQILAGENDCTFLFTDTFHEVADVFHRCQVSQEQIKLIDAGGSISIGKQFIGHVGKNVKQHGILHISACLQQPFDTECQEAAVRDVGMSVKKFGLRSFTHGVKS